ncbi:MAG: hypothetical protein GWN00_16010 [Aliifodinibius sp.]|nr:glycosyltransferase family 39 protein [Fodinibius sp.]NIV12552.1 hypothetical protein [Fodinibius sp.]NIY26254.1 hypothetical protein [Fodinibius sp.]
MKSIANISKIRLRPFVILFVLSIAVVTWSRYYYINKDGLQYIGIARLIKLGAWYDTVNAVRGPLISWLMAFLSTFLPELFAVRLIVSLASILTVLVSWFIIKSIIKDKAIRYVAILTIMFMPVIMNTSAKITPDTLLSVVALLGFYFGIKFIQIPDYKTAGILGMVWAIAYYTKSFGFVFAIVFFILLGLMTLLPYDRKTITVISKSLVFGLFIFGITVLPWLIAIRHKYGHWMFSSAGKFNLFYMGAYPQRDDPKLLHDAPWLDSEMFTKDNKMAGYHDYCPPGDVIFTYSVFDIDPYRQLKNFFANISSLVPYFWHMYGLSCIPIVLGLLFSMYVPFKEKQFQLISSGCIMWILMYGAVLIHRRYLMPVAPLIVIIACRGYEAIYCKFGHDNLDSGVFKYRRILTVLLLVQIVGSIAFGVIRVARYVRKYQTEISKYVVLAQDLAETYHIGKIANTNSCDHEIAYLAYLGDIPYAGAIIPERHKNDWIDLIKKGNISHVVVLAGELDNSETDELKFVREFSARGKDFLMYEILYNE